jgi:alkaline phosphatase D
MSESDRDNSSAKPGALGAVVGSNLLQPRAMAATRRGFLSQLTAGAAAVGSLGLAACGGSDNSSTANPTSDNSAAVPVVTWQHGVASGDPLSDRVVLWTRISTSSTDSITVSYQVARDAEFFNVFASGTTTTSSAVDFTVKVDAIGLAPNTRYFYRFLVGTQYSPVGKTRTTAASGASQVKLAVFSCSNYSGGYFNVYAEAAKRDDLDATVHLGDYLYEYGKDVYPPATGAFAARTPTPTTEILTLSEYRKRHALYKSDPDLQALHAAVPMIAVWDDHEITNDTWMNGAENHNPDKGEGDFALRKAAAIQAYHEWMPTRVTKADTIYRSFDFGGLVALHMLDTRLIGRDKQLDYTSFFNTSGSFNSTAFVAAVSSPTRQLMGATQTSWLQQQMGASKSTWQLLGQQVLIGRMNIPSPILFEALNPGTGVSVSQYSAIAVKAQTAPQTLTPTEQFILAQPAIPYNLDAWDGYAAARETVFGMAKALDKNLVVLSGDTHNAWGNDLLDLSGTRVGVEFGGSSVSSPGFETIFPDDPAVLAGSLTQLIPTLKYADTSRRGFMLVTATAAECKCEWIFVNTVASRSYTASVGKTLRTLPGLSTGRRLVA